VGIGAAVLGHVVLLTAMVTLTLTGVASGPPGLLKAWVDGLQALRADRAQQADFESRFDVLADVSFVSEDEILPEPLRQDVLPDGDFFQRLHEPQAPRPADMATQDKRAPVPDSGDGEGGPPPDEAFRQDARELRSLLSDGATRYLRARRRLARRAASPQAFRREPKTGEGDTSRRRRGAPHAPLDPSQMDLRLDEVVAEASPNAVPLTADDAESEPAESIRQVQENSAAARPVVATDATKAPVDGTSDLLAEEGQRAFDVENRGAAADVADARAASDERRPSVMDLSAPRAPGTGETNRGAGDNPGATAREGEGHGLSLTRAPADLRGPQSLAESRPQERSPYEREIRRRAATALKWPKRLALLMRQGETIVRFEVAKSGQLRSVRVVKSARFREFDEAAVAAVRAGAPYAAMPSALVINMRFRFRNPMVR